MAFVFTTIASYPDIRTSIVEITLDGTTYAAGGIPVTNAQLGMLANPDSVDAEFSTGDGFVPHWIFSTSKLKIYKNAAGAGVLTEVAAADLSTSMKVRLTCIGKPVV